MQTVPVGKNETWQPGNTYHLTYKVDAWRIGGYDIIPDAIKEIKIQDAVTKFQTQAIASAKVESYTYNPNDDSLTIRAKAIGPASPIIAVAAIVVAICLVIGISIAFYGAHTILTDVSASPVAAGLSFSVLIVAGMGIWLLLKGGGSA